MAPSIHLILSEPHSMNTSLEEDIRAAAEAGFACLDLWAPKLGDYLANYPVASLDARLREHSIYVAAISGAGPIPAYQAGSASREEQIVFRAQFLEHCMHLDALGGGIIVVCPGPRPGREIGEKALTAWTVRSLRGLSGLAAPFEVQVAFEFRGDVSSSVRSLQASQEIVDLVGRRNVRLALSTFQLQLSGSGPEQVEALHTGKLALVHFGGIKDLSPEAERDEKRLLPGRGVLLLQDTCRRLAAKGFRGPYSVQLPAGQHLCLGSAALARQAALEVLAPLYP